jgi:hypothetical protein
MKTSLAILAMLAAVAAFGGAAHAALSCKAVYTSCASGYTLTNGDCVSGTQPPAIQCNATVVNGKCCMNAGTEIRDQVGKLKFAIQICSD